MNAARVRAEEAEILSYLYAYVSDTEPDQPIAPVMPMQLENMKRKDQDDFKRMMKSRKRVQGFGALTAGDSQP